MPEKSIWYQIKILNPCLVLYDQGTRNNQGMIPNFANKMTFMGYSFFIKIDDLYSCNNTGLA